MSEEKIIWADCKRCARKTQHEEMYIHHISADPDEYPDAETWQVIRCRGCLNIAFRYQYDDYCDVHETDDGNYEHTTTVSLFPKTIRNHKRLDCSYYIPDVIRNVYQQTLSAYGEEAYILASVGLRATIEATCNHLKISGNSLEKRIDQLFKAGHVSNGDKRRLHAIRFLGNDAAHEILEPNESELRVALEIVEHLLNSVFILEKKAKRLETVIETYDEFLKALSSSVKQLKLGETMSVANILGRKRRLVTQSLTSFEAKLIDDISAGNIAYLKLEKIEKIDGRDIQLYTIGEVSKPQVNEEDEFSFL
ncbi:DUF4145 domain-containing protein [Geobacter pelophilus]|uniref:DUF4145 domain-containing protein n=1 Tax=Geoanaerobacter pelophilus TaxID=60036 RepID=A0AAW4L1T8_9BACT|nr:DUF4145 domain-containing protein [Geoanaerobacter pelophilus]MBT0664679.1 DUF4145 domain-containing protein [Geoanaerobacter pelophilus]